MSAIKWSEVVKKAWKDPEFKDFLLDNPREAIEAVTHTTLPDDFEFFVHEQTNNQVHLVLPMPEANYTKASNGDGDEKAVFLEPDDAGDGDKKAVFLEPDDAGGDEKAVFLEPDDAGGGDEKAVFLEPDDTEGK